MSRNSLAFSALMLLVVAGVSSSADTPKSNTVTKVETRKIVTEGSSNSQSVPVDTSKPINSTKQSETKARARVLFITAKGSEQCDKELSRLNKPGGDFEAMRARGWKIGISEDDHIQMIDRDEVPDLVRQLRAHEFPTVASIEGSEIVRSFKDGCSTPLDAWTFGWLLKGQNERPNAPISEAIRVETTGNYRLRGNHWTVEGDPAPAKQTIINHLRGPNHGHASGSYGAIENWSYEELRSLHDDLHEREGGTIGVAMQFSNQPVAANRSLDAFSGNRKVTGR